MGGTRTNCDAKDLHPSIFDTNEVYSIWTNIETHKISLYIKPPNSVISPRHIYEPQINGSEAMAFPQMGPPKAHVRLDHQQG